METVTIWQVLVGLLVPMNLGAIGFVLKRVADNEKRNMTIHGKLFDRLEAVEKDFSDHRVYAEQTFAHSNGMRDVEDRIMRHLSGIEKNIERLSDVIIKHLTNKADA